MAIKDLFIKNDEQVQNPVSPKSTSTQVETPVNPIIVSQSAPVSVTSISSDEEIVNKIWQEILSKNLPGPDYLELKNNFNALNGMPLSDDQKLMSSFNILKANYKNFNKDVILRSIDTYIGIVNEEKSEGLKEVENMRSEKVVAKEQHILELKSKADDLKREYESILKQIDEESTSVASEKLSIDNKERMFTASVDTVLNTLTSDKSKISALNI